MLIETVNCMIAVRSTEGEQTPSTQVYRCGVNALPVTEVRLMQFQHGMDAVSLVSHAGEYEITAREERERLARAYRAELVSAVYPIGAMMLPRTSEDLDLEPDQFDRNVKTEAA